MIVDNGVAIMAHTVESIKHLLATNDRAVGRALVVLTARQTEDERSAETTKHLNGRGWRPCHARMGTSMAKFFEQKSYLSPKQVAYWRKPMACGTPRIAIYARQLLEQAELNAAKTVKAVEPRIDADELEALKNTYIDLQRDYVRSEADGDRFQCNEISGKLRYIETLLGKTAAVFDEDERAMQRMEAEQDRLQTIRDEMNKHRAREYMECRS